MRLSSLNHLKDNPIAVQPLLQLADEEEMTPDGGAPLGSIFTGRWGWGMGRPALLV
jgi:hypothetical protein